MTGGSYAIGLDFGTLSGRAVLVNMKNGDELAEAVKNYPHGVMTEQLPESGTKLGKDWALQDPDDYLDVLVSTVCEVMHLSQVKKEQVKGIGLDFTSCTMMPIAEDGDVLCQKSIYRSHPHAWVKLWKHHAAWPEAEALSQVARDRGERFIQRFNQGISSEWFFPKVWQILKEAPDIYEAADRFIEAADWMVLKMTGTDVRSCCTAGYKALWSKKDGFPSRDFFRALDPRLEHVIEEKMNARIHPVGVKAGELLPEWANKMGLEPGTAVAVGMIDAHVAVPALNVVRPDEMVMIMGTSTCHMVLSHKERFISGVSSVVEDGILPGFYGYEAGQSAVGDIFDWFVRTMVPGEEQKKAAQKGMSIHQYLESKASRLKPGQSSLLAIDWWNGCRLLSNDDLSGLIVGLTLRTKPEEIYRALIEATAFGTRRIIDSFQKGGIPIRALHACGGLAMKNRMLMQIYADITGMEITVGRSKQTPAIGSAMYGAAAAGTKNGGYASVIEAAKRMSQPPAETYRPNPEHAARYNALYKKYLRLYEYFGSESLLMKELRQIDDNE
ncbi:ribulokinase [Sporolactobacillus sp. THM7-7]|nr:ribulokinase [Sporolactobacillus sp. THM7-7]